MSTTRYSQSDTFSAVLEHLGCLDLAGNIGHGLDASDTYPDDHEEDEEDDDDDYDYGPSLYQQQNLTPNGIMLSEREQTVLMDDQNTGSCGAQQSIKRLPFAYPTNHYPPTMVTEDVGPSGARHDRYGPVLRSERRPSSQPHESSGQPEPLYESWAEETSDHNAFLQSGQLGPAVSPPAYNTTGYYSPAPLGYTASSLPTTLTNAGRFPLPTRSIPFTMPALRAPLAPAPALAFPPGPMYQWQASAAASAFPSSQPPQPQRKPAAPAPQPKKNGYVRRADKGPRPPSKKYPSRPQKQKVFYPVELLPFGKSGTLEVHEVAKRAGAGKGKKEARACPLCKKIFETEHRLKDHLESPVHRDIAVGWGGGGGEGSRKKRKGRGGGGAGGGS